MLTEPQRSYLRDAVAAAEGPFATGRHRGYALLAQERLDRDDAERAANKPVGAMRAMSPESENRGPFFLGDRMLMFGTDARKQEMPMLREDAHSSWCFDMNHPDCPKNGDLVLLLVPSDATGLEDEKISRTIGSFAVFGDDEVWTYPQWNWSHDCFYGGDGNEVQPQPIAWAFVPALPKGGADAT